MAFDLLRYSPRNLVRKVILNAVKEDGLLLRYTPLAWRDDTQIVRIAVANNGHALQYASFRLRNNKDIVLTAIAYKETLEIPTYNMASCELEVNSDYKCIFSFASSKLRNNKKIVLTAVKNNPYALEHASNEMKGDREIVLAAITKQGWCLSFASSELRSDKNMVLAAVSNYGLLIRVLIPRWRKDIDVVIASAIQYYSCIDQYVDEMLDAYVDWYDNTSFLNELLYINLPICDSPDNTYYIILKCKSVARTLPQIIVTDIMSICLK